jgi:O-antigen/teichoic acid export membrane protein
MTAIAAAPTRASGTTDPEEQRKALATGAGWLTLSTVVVGGLNYAYSLALTHLLPADKYAQFAAAQALLLTAGTVASASIPWVLAQQLAKHPDRAAKAALTRMAMLGNCVQGVVAAVVILGVSRSFADPQTAFILSICVFLIFASSTTPGWLQGRQRFLALAAIKVTEVVVKCAVGIVLALGTRTAAAPLGAFGAGAAIVFVLGLYWFRHQLFGPITFGMVRSLWRDAVGVASVQGLVSALASLDVVLVAVLPLASSAAASYQASMIIARVPLFIGSAVAMVALPMIARATRGQSAQQYRDAVRLYAVVALPFAVMLATTPKDLVYLVFPKEFGDITAILPWTAASGLMIGAVELITTFYQGRSEYRPSLVCQSLAAVVSVAAILTGFHLDGIVGLSIGAFAGTAVAVVFLLVDSARRWPGSVRLPFTGLVLAVGLAAGLLLAAQNPIVWVVACLATVGWMARQVLASRDSEATPERPGARHRT